MNKKLIERAEKINWWHTIKLSDDYTTKGRVGLDHCSPEVITNRFGMPENLTGKTVLDIGAFDGLMSFEAEKRGAKKVVAIDCFQGEGENSNGFEFAKEVLESNVFFVGTKLSDYTYQDFDITLYFGVLYHVENIIDELVALWSNTIEYSLIETAIAQNDYGGKSVWEFNNGFDSDHTNFWYPTIAGLTNMLHYVGYKKVEVIYNDGIRATVKAIK